LSSALSFGWIVFRPVTFFIATSMYRHLSVDISVRPS
jgi:hypothetical protein